MNKEYNQIRFVSATKIKKQKHGILFAIFVFWLLSLPFARYSLVAGYSIDNILAPFLCLAAIALPRLQDKRVATKRFHVVLGMIGLYLLYRFAWLISYINEPSLFWSFLWQTLRSGFYFIIPALYIRDLWSFRVVKSVVILIALIAALSAFLASIGVVNLAEERFGETRIDAEWLPKAIGLFTSYGDVAILYGFTAVVLASHGRSDVWLGMGSRVGKSVVWFCLLLGLVGSQSRNMLLSTITALAVLWLFRVFKTENLNKRMMVGGIVGALSILGIGMVIVYASQIAEAISGLGGQGAYQTAQTRLTSYAQAMTLIAREPILGVSLDTYKVWGPLVEGIHNMWLKLLLKGGVISFTAIIGLLWIAYKNGKPSAHPPVHPAEPALVVSSVAAIIVASQFYGGLGDILWVMISMLISFSWVRLEKADSAG